MEDSDDELDVGSSWISMKSLREAANVKYSFKKQPESIKSSSSASPSPNSSITMEWKPNTFINQSVSFSFVHENYRNGQEQYDTMIDSDDNEEANVGIREKRMKKLIQSHEFTINNLEERYDNDVAVLKRKLLTANRNLASAHEEIARINTENAKLQLEFASRLENIQAHHQRKA